jgi:hypothetical protein
VIGINPVFLERVNSNVTIWFIHNWKQEHSASQNAALAVEDVLAMIAPRGV